ncbi:uncharacterized protein LOC109825665 [Asparagus officinalis]|uniref:uncharacterized protein LOC109825665 n=1 Tax=Asparagus officinalis TaxID=4686 RepID=UPI00098DFCF9|nr:uncharacterized protein LOC109825665 [Asparagus officinalis]
MTLSIPFSQMETDLMSSHWDSDDEYEKFIQRMNPPRVVLLHASYPFSREASYLASVYPQVCSFTNQFVINFMCSMIIGVVNFCFCSSTSTQLLKMMSLLSHM